MPDRPRWENRADRIPDPEWLAKMHQMETALAGALELLHDGHPWVAVQGMLYNLRARIDEVVDLPISPYYRFSTTTSLTDQEKARLLRDTEVPDAPPDDWKLT